MVIYEDNHLLVVNKPCGILVQGDATGDQTILDYYKGYIKKKYDKPGAVYLHPAHRLDRPVSGCLILARTSKALSRMTTLFRNNEVSKQYYAITSEESQKPEGVLVDYLIKDQHKNITKLAKKGQAKAKLAELSFRLAASTNGYYLYEVLPKTGRGHQIRVQLSGARCPILGDVKYNGDKIKNNRSIYLHCHSMQFVHPVKKEVLTVSCLPGIGDKWSQFISFMQEL